MATKEGTRGWRRAALAAAAVMLVGTIGAAGCSSEPEHEGSVTFDVEHAGVDGVRGTFTHGSRRYFAEASGDVTRRRGTVRDDEGTAVATWEIVLDDEAADGTVDGTVDGRPFVVGLSDPVTFAPGVSISATTNALVAVTPSVRALEDAAEVEVAAHYATIALLGGFMPAVAESLGQDGVGTTKSAFGSGRSIKMFFCSVCKKKKKWYCWGSYRC